MQLLSLRNGFLVLTFTAIASAGGLITGCTNTASQNQSQAPNATAINTSDTQMNHSMAMDLGPADANFDLRFIDAMTPHHQGAVEMAKEAQQKSKRPEIRKLADDIIKSQNQEITQMKQWRQAWYPSPLNSDKQMNHSMAMDLGPADTNFDLRFIDAMIPHHQGAMEMAKEAQQKSKRPEIKKLADAIIKSQNQEITQMKLWRQSWYHSPLNSNK